MPDLNALLERRAKTWDDYQEVLERSKTADEISAEDRASLDRLDESLSADSADIDRLQKADAQRAKADDIDRSTIPGADPKPGDEGRDKGVPGDEQYRQAFVEFVTRGARDMSPEARETLRQGWQADGESRAAAVGTGSAGGYLVPQGFRKQIIEKQKAYGAVQDVATVITTTTGNALPWPTNDDTGNVGALLAENTQVTEQDIVLGQAQLDAYKYTSKLVRVSLEFLQDVDWLDAESFLARKFAERLARITNQHYTTGTGSSQPNGLVTGAVSGVTAAGVAAITSDELIDLEHSVDPAYRDSQRSKFMFSDTALKTVRKLKDSTNQYLWQPSVQAGVASTYNGYGYVINNDMAVPATGVKSVLFGDYAAGYVIRKVRDFQMIRLDERYADYFQVGFLAFERTDAEVQDTAAYKALVQA